MSKPTPIDPMHLTVDQAAAILSRSSAAPIDADQIRSDIDAGAPVNPDGTLNVVHYAAWLVKETARRGD